MTTDTTAVLALVREYGDARVRDARTATTHPEASALLEQITAALGPDPFLLAGHYLAGESLMSIARITGLTYHTVRSMILSTGTPMRAQGRPPKGRKTK